MFIVPVTRRNADIAHLFDSSLERLFRATPQADDTTSPALDLSESDQTWSVKLDLPGVAKEDVQIAIEGKNVSVQAQVRKDEAQAKEGERLVHRERTASRYARRFTLPAEVEQSESGAKLDNGVLTLTLAKKRANAAAHLTVN
jgi:HSP20 family protein